MRKPKAVVRPKQEARRQPFVPGSSGIVGMFEKQRWTGPNEDKAETRGKVKFDATAYVVNMRLADIREIRDHRESSDEIGQQHVSHDGPCSVEIEDAICEFFKVDTVKAITALALASAWEWLQSLPERTYSVRLTYETHHDAHVKAKHPSQVRKAAILGMGLTAPRGVEIASMHEIQ